MIPKYPDKKFGWVVFDWQAFPKQWSDHNYDNAPHTTCIEQEISFKMACFQGCTDHVVLLSRTQVDTYQTNTHWNAHTQVRAHTRKLTHTITQAHTHWKPQIIKGFEWLFIMLHNVMCFYIPPYTLSKDIHNCTKHTQTYTHIHTYIHTYIHA